VERVLFLSHLGEPPFAAKKGFDGRSGCTDGDGRIGEDAPVSHVPPLDEVGSEEFLHERTLKVLPTREPHEAVRVERIGGSGDAFMMEGESLLSPDRGNFCVELSGALPASELLRAVLEPIQATCRHGRGEF